MAAFLSLFSVSGCSSKYEGYSCEKTYPVMKVGFELRQKFYAAAETSAASLVYGKLLPLRFMRGTMSNGKEKLVFKVRFSISNMRNLSN